MIVSGIQSALAGGMFLVQANAAEPPHITAIVPFCSDRGDLLTLP